MARPAPAAERVLGILDLLVTRPTERFTLSELVRLTGMSLGSAHAVLTVLEDAGYVTRQQRPKFYSLGPALVVAGVVALEHHPAIEFGRRQLEGLASTLGVEAVLTARTRNDIIFVARHGQHSARFPDVREGERVPFVPPFGTIFLAWSKDEEIEDWLRRAGEMSEEVSTRFKRALDRVRENGVLVTVDSDTQRSVGERLYSLATDPSKTELRKDVEKLQSTLRGMEYFAFETDAEDVVQVGMIAAPIFDSQSNVTAAITVYGLESPMSLSECFQMADRVRQAALQATRESRGRPPKDRLASR
jgi:DNA-binding IclR family transcriptional regulator